MVRCSGDLRIMLPSPTEKVLVGSREGEQVCIAGKGVRNGGNLYLDMEVAIGSEVSGIRDGTVTSPGSMVSVNKYTMTT